MARMKNFKNSIEEMLFEIYKNIGIDKPSNHDDILEFVCDDVSTAADPVNWHSGDVAIAFRRWIETKSENQDDEICTEGLHIPSYTVKATQNIKGFNTPVVENIWSEIRNNYEEDGVVYIDAWEDDDNDSTGEVIAKIEKATGKVEYKDPRAKTDKHAQEMIAEVLKNKD